MSDDDVRDLERRLAVSPDDEALARTYERALLRAGRTDDVRARLLGRVACPGWESHDEDRRGHRVRWCRECKRSVHHVRTLEELDRVVAAGLQVAGSGALRDEVIARSLDRIVAGDHEDRLPDCFALAESPPREPVQEFPFAQILCSCHAVHGEYVETRIHEEVQDTKDPAWLRLLDLIEQAAFDGVSEFAPRRALGEELWPRIVTLPPTIAKLKKVRRLQLYGSHLVRIPPEIGQMESLEEFDPYTSYRLHWFPYEITRCKRLAKSRVSTRALYGNYKFRPAFPDLEVGHGPVSRTCSVCDQPAPTFTQYWLSLNVATDVLPLLVNACSDACVRKLPRGQSGYAPRPHRGGRRGRARTD